MTHWYEDATLNEIVTDIVDGIHYGDRQKHIHLGVQVVLSTGYGNCHERFEFRSSVHCEALSRKGCGQQSATMSVQGRKAFAVP